MDGNGREWTEKLGLFGKMRTEARTANLDFWAELGLFGKKAHAEAWTLTLGVWAELGLFGKKAHAEAWTLTLGEIGFVLPLQWLRWMWSALGFDRPMIRVEDDFDNSHAGIHGPYRHFSP